MIDQNDITHRLRCKYANGPMVNGEPEFGWRDMSCTVMTAFPTPIDLEAANLIEQLQSELAQAREQIDLRDRQIDSLAKYCNTRDTELSQLRASLAASMAWVDINECHPLAEDDYLVRCHSTDGYSVHAVEFNGIDFVGESCFFEIDDVSHVMKIIQPPAASNGQGE